MSEKLRVLESFLAPEEELHIVRQSEFQKGPNWPVFLLQGLRCDLAVSCLWDDDLNASLKDFCERHGILCNVVDQKEYCNTWFMGVAQTNSLLLGVSSKGECPYYTAQLRRELQVLLKQREPEAALLSECRSQLRRQALHGKELYQVLCDLHKSPAFAQSLQQIQIESDSSHISKIAFQLLTKET